MELTRLPPIELGYILDASRPIIPLTMETEQAGCAAPHAHPRAQLIFASAGVMRVVSRRAVWMVPPSQAVYVPPHIEHEVYFPGRVSLRNLFIDPSTLAGLPTACTVVSISRLLRELILRAAAIGDTYERDGPAWRLMQVVLDELRVAPPSPLHLPMANDERVRKVIEGLLANPADSRSLAAWARVGFTSSRHLSRLFVDETGMSFNAWRKQLRLLEAIERLGQGESVTAVADGLGYRSLSAFIAMFRQSLGMSPGQYMATPGNIQSSQSPHRRN